MLDTMKNRRMGIQAVHEKFGVVPDKVVEVQALAGDSTDNVPGVPGIGVKTAAQLIEDYGDLESLLEKAEEIKQPKRRENLLEFADQARISKELVTLKPDVPVEEALEDLTVKELDAEALVAFLSQQNFRTLVSKVASEHGAELDEEAEDHPTLDEADYVTISDLKTLDAWIEDAWAEGQLAVDTETTSLNPAFAKLVGIALAIHPGRACYIPVGHVGSGGEGTLDLDGSAPDQLDVDEVIKRLKPLLEDPGILKIGQNLKYDIFVLRRHGIDLKPYDDTMLISYALESGQHGHGMDELSQLHLGHTPITYKEVTGTGKKAITFDQVPIEEATPYAAEDADVTLRLHQILKPRLAEDHVTTVYEMLDRPLAAILAGMEEWGVKVDEAKLKELSAEFAEKMEQLEGEIHKLAG
ncbi:MAG: 5'-3' exonuclease H3TH domain-containing protein, partial [Alphaproteobacteria bacterium]|nr:5'-3' exonuclease H3TH domain-containing protein [Alphaproteobacteria bacterium]